MKSGERGGVPTPASLRIFLQVLLSFGEDSPRRLNTWAGSETPRSTWRELSRSEGAWGSRKGLESGSSCLPALFSPILRKHTRKKSLIPHPSSNTSPFFNTPLTARLLDRIVYFTWDSLLSSHHSGSLPFPTPIGNHSSQRHW